MNIKEQMKDHIVVMPGVFNAISAMIARDAGFDALYISGAGIANSVAGVPDIGLMTLTEVETQSRYIVDAVDIPCIIDGDTGFGEVVNVMRMVRTLEKAGLAGVHIEDQEMPKRCGHLSGKRIVSARVMTEKIAAAVEARRDPDFLIIARTDVRAIEGIDASIERAKMYLDAGADVIFPEALESRKEFAVFSKEIDAPLMANMTEFGKTPFITASQFESMGYNMVIFPLTAFRTMLKSVKNTLEKLKAEGTQKGMVKGMLTRRELYRLIGYKNYECVDKRIERTASPEG